jgi:UDP-N-acetylglucosamine 2-epimerase
MKVALIVGARPQFIKAAPLWDALRAARGIQPLLVHSGQHFDENMSGVFFRELGLPAPDFNLAIHSGGHGQMTGRMLEAIEGCLQATRPDAVVVFGDTNTTLAAALAAAKLQIPVAHVEAGLRSWNRTMPEEINRVLVDHCSAWLFCPTERAVANLAAEGITRGVSMVGDVMFDAVRRFGARAREQSTTLARHGLRPGEYFVLTLHRAYNTDRPETLRDVLAAAGALSLPVLFPVHPRTRPLLTTNGALPPNIIPCDPLGYLDMLCALGQCRCVLTDSGGLQKEAYFLGVPCVTLRPETEWVETVEAGWNVLAGTEPDGIAGAVSRVLAANRKPIKCYGDGHSAEEITALLLAGPAASAPA